LHGNGLSLASNVKYFPFPANFQVFLHNKYSLLKNRKEDPSVEKDAAAAKSQADSKRLRALAEILEHPAA